MNAKKKTFKRCLSFLRILWIRVVPTYPTIILSCAITAKTMRSKKSYWKLKTSFNIRLSKISGSAYMTGWISSEYTCPANKISSIPFWKKKALTGLPQQCGRWIILSAMKYGMRESYWKMMPTINLLRCNLRLLPMYATYCKKKKQFCILLRLRWSMKKNLKRWNRETKKSALRG